MSVCYRLRVTEDTLNGQMGSVAHERSVLSKEQRKRGTVDTRDSATTGQWPAHKVLRRYSVIKESKWPYRDKLVNGLTNNGQKQYPVIAKGVYRLSKERRNLRNNILDNIGGHVSRGLQKN